jgi:predicted dienelactone hydrolase
MMRALALLILFAAPATRASEPASASRQIRLVDESRPVKASMGFVGSPSRRIDVRVWQPAGHGPFPLVIYSHGTFGSADNAMHIVEHLVAHGYIVAAPDYPLTSSAAFTKVRIDAAKIGTTGHSLGAVTSYFTVFGQQTRDPRIAATALIAGGDPVESALMSDMGLLGTGHAAVRVPALFLSAEKDVFARITGRPYASYSRVEGPKTEVMIKGGVHVWFRGTPEVPADGKNPDCLFFERMMPGQVMPGCETRGGLIAPARQQAITRDALLAFFDGYLKKDARALARLRGLGRTYREVSVRAED